MIRFSGSCSSASAFGNRPRPGGVGQGGDHWPQREREWQVGLRHPKPADRPLRQRGWQRMGHLSVHRMVRGRGLGCHKTTRSQPETPAAGPATQAAAHRAGWPAPAPQAPRSFVSRRSATRGAAPCGVTRIPTAPPDNTAAHRCSRALASRCRTRLSGRFPTRCNSPARPTAPRPCPKCRPQWQDQVGAIVDPRSSLTGSNVSFPRTSYCQGRKRTAASADRMPRPRGSGQPGSAAIQSGRVRTAIRPSSAS